jgi:hypothetical protein
VTFRWPFRWANLTESETLEAVALLEERDRALEDYLDNLPVAGGGGGLGPGDTARAGSSFRTVNWSNPIVIPSGGEAWLHTPDSVGHYFLGDGPPPWLTWDDDAKAFRVLEDGLYSLTTDFDVVANTATTGVFICQPMTGGGPHPWAWNTRTYLPPTLPGNGQYILINALVYLEAGHTVVPGSFLNRTNGSISLSGIDFYVEQVATAGPTP